MKLSPYIKELLSKQCGRDIATAADCTLVALDIESKTGEHVGVNTLKRLLGFIDDEREPRLSTLNIIARYLNQDCWPTLKLLDDNAGNSDFNDTLTELHAAQLKPGAMIEITYLPNRRLVIKCQGNNSFVVVESENGKLRVGDTLHLDHLVRGYPLLVSEVVRGGTSLGTFTAGKAQGIQFKLL